MAFSKNYRVDMITDIRRRFKCYWHVMHPVTFEPAQLYQLGYTPEEWEALMLLKKCHDDEVIQTGYRFRYTTTKGDDVDADSITLQFKSPDNLPDIDILEEDIPSKVGGRLRAWAKVALHYDELDTLLGSKIRQLVHQESSGHTWDNKVILKAQVNTPGTLHRVWPELLPFLKEDQREVMRNKTMKSPLPRMWDADTFDEFHAGPEMEELTTALSAMVLLPDEWDRNYPSVS